MSSMIVVVFNIVMENIVANVLCDYVFKND
jgi:hypothetical protein